MDFFTRMTNLWHCCTDSNQLSDDVYGNRDAYNRKYNNKYLEINNKKINNFCCTNNNNNEEYLVPFHNMTKKREICYGLKKSLDPLEMNRYNIMDKKHRKSYRKRYKSRSSFFIKTIGYCWFVDNTKVDQEKREHNKKRL